MTITKQMGPTWYDETGAPIPVNRVTKSEKLREARAYALATAADKLSTQLAKFKRTVTDACDEVIDAIKAEHDIKTDSKGNVTWYNFDRSIKIEISINDMIKFDDVLIEGAKDILLGMIDSHIKGDDFIKAIVIEAFQTTKGKLDTKRILGLKRHGSRIRSEEIKQEWAKAMDLIDRATTRPDSRRYFRIWVREDDNSYTAIDLNFSSVTPARHE